MSGSCFGIKPRRRIASSLAIGAYCSVHTMMNAEMIQTPRFLPLGDIGVWVHGYGNTGMNGDDEGVACVSTPSSRRTDARRGKLMNACAN